MYGKDKDRDNTFLWNSEGDSVFILLFRKIWCFQELKIALGNVKLNNISPKRFLLFFSFPDP